MEQSVQKLISQCYCESGRYYLLVSSPTMREKPVYFKKILYILYYLLHFKNK